VKIKHLRYWLAQTTALAELSECSRRKFGAIIIDPESNVALVNGYNGAARGGQRRCGGNVECARDAQGCESGTRLEIGCNHAEANAIANASRTGISTLKKWLIVNGEPCLACAKLIHQAGISKVICVRGGYSTCEGVEYLERYTTVHRVDPECEDELRGIIGERSTLPTTPFALPTRSSPFAVKAGIV
jgi:dCMP deaminase